MPDELNKPSRGTGDWDIPLNENFDKLEAAARAFLPRGTTQTLNVADIKSNNISTESIKPRFLAEDYLYAGGFSGSDPDARLGNCLANASFGDTVMLENDAYNQDRTIDKRICFIGTRMQGGTLIDANFTCNSKVTVEKVALLGTITLNSIISSVRGISRGNIQINADRCLITQCDNTSVTFASGTARGIVDSCSIVSVTDNGNNTVGDIS
jgi:hypothetical protein